MSDRASLQLLGAIEVERDGGTIPLRGSQAQLLLTFVALRRHRPVPVEELADLLWGDQVGEHWQGALRGVVAKVRAFLGLLGPDVVSLMGHRRSYSLRWADPAAIDVFWAETLEASARLALGNGDLSSAAEGAAEAAAILSEPLLPGVEADWLAAPRSHLTATCRRAHRTAAQAWSELGRHEVAVVAARSAVATDPYDEASQRTLLTVHLSAGNRTEGLRSYERFRRLAATELGVDPDERTQALYVRLLGAPSVPGPAHAADDWDAPFVGREAELALLTEAWAASRSGRRISVGLHGGAGAGKTMLALEGARRTGATVLYGRCASERTIPYQPFLEALGSHRATLDEDDSVGDLDAALDHLLPISDDGDRTSRSSQDSTGSPHRATVFNAVARAIRRIAAEPLVMIIDDLHWADAATHRLARHLLGSLEVDPLLVLITFRDDAPPDDELARTVTELHRLGRYRTIAVPGLTRVDVSSLLDQAGLGPSVSAAALHERTGGNPLYVGQMIRAWKEADGAVDEVTIPSTVRGLIASRTDALDAAARSALEIASVIGTSIPGHRLDAVLAVAGVSADAVDRLVERHFLVELDHDRLHFEHVLLRDAVYAQLPERKRRRLHGWVARVIDSGGGDVDPITLAHHYEAAGDVDDAHGWYEAVRRSADHAMRVHAYEQAQTWARSMLRLVERRPEAGPRLDAMLLLGAAQRRAGDLDGAAATLLDARQLAVEEGRSDHVAVAVLELVGHAGRGAAVHLSDDDRAGLIRDALERLGAGSPERRAALLAEHALALLLTGRTDEITASAAEAERVAVAVHDPRVDADTVVAGRLLRPTPEHAAERRRRIDELVDRHAPMLTEEQLIRLQLWRVTDCFELGDRNRIDAELASLSSMAETLDQPYWRWLAATWQAVDRFVRGEDAEAETMAGEALTAIAPMGHPEPPLAHGIQVAGFRIRQGRGGEVLDLLDQVVLGAPTVSGLRCPRVAALASVGRHDEARAEIDAILDDDLRALPRDTSWGPSLACLAEACHDARAPEAAVTLLPALTPYRGRFVTVTAFGAGGACHGPYDEAVALLHRCVGDEAAATEAFDAAITACRRAGAHGLRRHVERRASGRHPTP